MTHRMRTQLMPLFAIVMLTACGAARPSRPGMEQERTVLQVENRSFADMTIYVIEGGARRRLGTATGGVTTELTIPATLIYGGRDLQFLADPIGSSRTAVSDRIFVRPGERVTLMIPPR